MQRRLGGDSLAGQFYRTFNEEIIPILRKHFLKIEEEDKLQSLFLRQAVTSSYLPKQMKIL